MNDDFEKSLDWYIGNQDESWSEEAERFGVKVGRWSREWCAEKQSTLKLYARFKKVKAENQRLREALTKVISCSSAQASAIAKKALAEAGGDDG